MKTICSYCRTTINDDHRSDHIVSHGMCRECFEHFSRQWEGQRMGEFLDMFDFPVMLVTREGRISAANQIMADLLGKTPRDLMGLLGGEASECVYARLPEGCGQTVHCHTCTIRKAVTSTYESGKTITRRAAYIQQSHGRLEVYISTEKHLNQVKVILEPKAK